MSNTHYLPDTTDNTNKWHTVTQTSVTPLGIGKRKRKRINSVHRTDTDTRFQGIVQSVTHTHIPVIDLTETGHVIRMNDNEQAITQQRTNINGRSKQVNNKKAQGELRRKSSQSTMDGINVRSRAFYRAKYGN